MIDRIIMPRLKVSRRAYTRRKFSKNGWAPVSIKCYNVNPSRSSLISTRTWTNITVKNQEGVKGLEVNSMVLERALSRIRLVIKESEGRTSSS